MKILFINKFLYRKGGAETYMLDIATELKKRGHEIQFFGMYDKKNEVGNQLNLYTKNVDFHQKSIANIWYPFTIIYSLEAKLKLRKLLNYFKPDIVHLNNINFQITPSVIDEIYNHKIPIIQTVHDFQFVCPNHLLYNPKQNKICTKCISKSKWNCMSGKCIHGSFLKSMIGSLEAILYKHKDTYSYINELICPSKFMKKVLSKDQRFDGKTTFLQNFSKEYENKTYAKQDYVLYFGRLYEEKGIRNIVEAAKQLKEIPFVIAGEGPLEPICAGIENLKFVGYKTGEELERLISEAKFCVYPSIWYENCPLSIIESQKLGTPVLTTSIGGMKELVDKNLLINGVTATDLVSSISKAYYQEEFLKEMMNDAKKRARNYQSVSDYVNSLIKIYKRNL